MNEVLDTILNTTYTQNQLKHRLRVLKSYLLNAIFGGPPARLAAERAGRAGQNTQIDTSDLAWLSGLPPSFYKNFNKDNVYQIFDTLEKLIKELPILTIYLPIEATDNIVLQIGSFARKTLVKPKLMLDTKYDPTLIAGCALVWQGVYKDYSLRARIEERKEEVLQNFKKFLK